MAEAQTPAPSCQLCCQEIVAQQTGGNKQPGGNNNIYSMNVNESPTLLKLLSADISTMPQGSDSCSAFRSDLGEWSLHGFVCRDVIGV